MEWAKEAYQISLRRACSASGFCRSTMAYRSRRSAQEGLRSRLKELAAVRTGAGYLQLHTLLRREGWLVNHKRVYRLYCEEGLGLTRKKKRRRRSGQARAGEPAVVRPNQRWAMDFMHDTLYDGRKLRVLTVIDVFTRECLALEAGRSFSGGDVAMVLDRLVSRCGKPEAIQCDQGTEFTSLALDLWAYTNNVALLFSPPGTPGDNARNEAFNGLVRRECLTHHYFLGLREAATVLQSWKEDYNNQRPHGSLGRIPPAQFRADWSDRNDPEGPENVS